MEQQFTVTSQEAGQRLDLFCVAKLIGFSRAAIQKAIKDGQITVNGQPATAKQVVRADAVITMRLTGEATSPQPPAPPIALPTLYEDRHVVVINKPAGVAMYDGSSNTVAAWFSEHYPSSKEVAVSPERPGIVHRLDKNTSGVVILAKTHEALEFLLAQFKERRAKKEYVVLVFGAPGEKKGRITREIARSKRNPMRRTVVERGREAITEWKLEEKFDSFSLLRVWPLTGRMHQIRVHLHWLGFPVVGDPLYTIRHKRPPIGVSRQLLHAEKLTIKLPGEGVKTFQAPLPKDLAGVLQQLRDARA